MILHNIDRRGFGAAALGCVAASVSVAQAAPPDPSRLQTPSASAVIREVKALEMRGVGRIGVVAIDTGTGAVVAYRADERFPMCSTHKILVGAAILSMISAGRLKADQRIAYGHADLLEYAPLTTKNVEAGFMTVEALGEAAVRWSDNTADNLLLTLLGGPKGWTQFARSMGDRVSRLDRFEPDLNSGTPGDVRDTSSPRAMTGMLAALLLGRALDAGPRSKLESWMYESPITGALFRKRLPAGWHVSDKSGSGSNGTRNDVGIIYPPRSAPIILTVFHTGSNGSTTERDEIIAECASVVAQHFRPVEAASAD
ncbi:class A beta-lactamase [Sphingomonas sp. UV9]|uniref:class A beta-lactamase n=1 Tax=Sphingomonas sp. UV9 TaxID=1851410 RepID=UPI000FFC72F6|nr:class A beta-lactamase [Sphingomonas sp. UV9]RXD04812.1 class A beta-lactamase [Sphingomonas sp. UV9]